MGTQNSTGCYNLPTLPAQAPPTLQPSEGQLPWQGRAPDNDELAGGGPGCCQEGGALYQNDGGSEGGFSSHPPRAPAPAAGSPDDAGFDASPSRSQRGYQGYAPVDDAWQFQGGQQ